MLRVINDNRLTTITAKCALASHLERVVAAVGNVLALLELKRLEVLFGINFRLGNIVRCRKVWKIACFCVVSVLLPSYALAQDQYPSKPIRFIVPYPPGGSYDAIARFVGQKLAEAFGQQVVIDNRPGAGGIIGTSVAARASANGYSILMFGNNQTILPNVYREVPFNFSKDFSPVTMVATVTDVLLVHPAVPAHSVSELILLAKSKPGELNFGSGGKGGPTHLAGELLKSLTGINIVHVPYKGGAPAVLALVTGEVQLMVVNMLSARPLIETGKVRPLAVASLSRSSFLPDVPTMVEAGVPNYEVMEWYGVMVPSGTPKGIIAKLNSTIRKIIRLEETARYFRKNGADPLTNTPKEFGEFLKEDLAKYAKIAKEARIQLE